MNPSEDFYEIDRLVSRFFSLFEVPEGSKADLSIIYELFVPEGMIIKAITAVPEIYSLESFIKPRERLFDTGVLKGFKEWETESKTDCYGHIAQRFSCYEKYGTLNGVYFEARGKKSFQFLKTTTGWRISSVIWDDAQEEQIQ